MLAPSAVTIKVAPESGAFKRVGKDILLGTRVGASGNLSQMLTIKGPRFNAQKSRAGAHLPINAVTHRAPGGGLDSALAPALLRTSCMTALAPVRSWVLPNVGCLVAQPERPPSGSEIGKALAAADPMRPSALTVRVSAMLRRAAGLFSAICSHLGVKCSNVVSNK